MTSDEAPASLELLIARSRVAAERALANEAAAGERLPSPGEVYVLAATAELPVEWTLVERHPDDLDRFWAVPADAHPFASEDDVEIPAGDPAGFLVLRCALGVWLRADALAPERRSRVLASEALDQARRAVAEARERRWAEPARQAGGGSPEISDWHQEVLLPACAAASAGPRALPAPPAPRPPRRALPRWLPWAAAAGLLAVTAGLLAGLQGERRESARRLEKLQEESSVLRQQSADRQEKWNRRETTLEQERQDEALRYERRIAEIIGGRAEPSVNLPRISLRPSEVLRAEPPAVRLPEESPELIVSLALPQGASFPAYRLTLRQDTRTLWQSSRLTEIQGEELDVILPRRFLTPGTRLLLRLEGLRSDQASLVAEYNLPIA